MSYQRYFISILTLATCGFTVPGSAETLSASPSTPSEVLQACFNVTKSNILSKIADEFQGDRANVAQCLKHLDASHFDVNVKYIYSICSVPSDANNYEPEGVEKTRIIPGPVLKFVCYKCNFIVVGF